MPPGPDKVVTEFLQFEVLTPRPPAFTRGMSVIALLAATGKWNVQV
jgi:hypothetical protein